MPPATTSHLRRSAARRASAAAAFALALALATAGGAPAASSSTVVTADIPSAIQLTNGCVGAAATSFGVVQPGTGATTATGACTVGWASSNNSSMLRIAQRDRSGTAMSRPGTFTGAINWSQFTSIASADGTSIVAGGNGGDYGFSTDGGATWTVTSAFNGNSAIVNAVVQLPGDPTTVWLAGDGTRLDRVTSALTAPSPTSMMPNLLAAGWNAGSSPYSIVMIDDDSLIVGGENGWIARSDDDGATWSAFQLPSTGTVRDLSLAPTGHVWAATRGSVGGNIWRAPATGGGVLGDWTQFATAGGSNLTAIVVTGPTNGYAVGTTGSFWAWNGTAWAWRGNTTLEADDYFDVTSPPGQPAVAAIVGEDGSIVRTTDGGTTLAKVDSRVGSDLAAAASGAGWMLAAGKARSVVSSGDAGVTWTFQYDEASPRGRVAIAMEPVDGRILLTVGSRGGIWRSTDSGGSWSAVASGTVEPLNDVEFVSSTTAFAVGGGGTILRSVDAGLTWSPVASGTSQRLHAVSAPRNHTLVVAVGEDGTVARSTNGGTSFTSTSIAAGRELKDVSFADDDVGALVGYQFLRRSVDGGATWTTPPSMPTAQPMVAVSMATATTGFALPAWNRVWRTTDGGATWVETTGLSGDNFDIDAVNEDVVHIVGTNMFSTADGGDSWQFQPTPTVTLTSVAAGDGNYVVAGSNVGTVQVRLAETAPGLAVPDYGASPNSWAPSAEAMFGVCVQSPGAQTSMSAPWVADADTCTASDGDPWRAIPTSLETVATVPVAGNVGSVDLVWGVRFAPTQPPGVYTAGIVFEALAPAV